MKQILLGLLGLAAFIVFVGVLTNKNQTLIPIPKKSPTPSLKSIKVGQTEVAIEVADSEEERSQGLSGRKSLDGKEGMLFVFPGGNAYPSFWMKDMLFPLDIIWIDNSKVVKIEKNIPAPDKGAGDASLTLYHPDKPIDYVLEVNAGFSDTNDIVVGDNVDLTGL